MKLLVLLEDKLLITSPVGWNHGLIVNHRAMLVGAVVAVEDARAADDRLHL